jgi:hypothetical protein
MVHGAVASGTITDGFSFPSSESWRVAARLACTTAMTTLAPDDEPFGSG